jgi:predicted house-cleaning noncanonical NTP pyrophosphatase (MazG superfamily)
MRYEKLVRDKIPEIIQRNGGDPVTHIADEAEYLDRLKRKLEEEVAEFLKDQTGEELADILEVVYALGATLDFSQNDLERIRKEKHTERGGFKKRIILEEVV